MMELSVLRLREKRDLVRLEMVGVSSDVHVAWEKSLCLRGHLEKSGAAVLRYSWKKQSFGGAVLAP